jgi:hypothetical protein
MVHRDSSISTVGDEDLFLAHLCSMGSSAIVEDEVIALAERSYGELEALAAVVTLPETRVFKELLVHASKRTKSFLISLEGWLLSIARSRI